MTQPSKNAPLRFQINHYSAWSAGIETIEQWHRLFQHNERPVVEDNTKADVSFIPAMQRRRLSPLARAVFHVANHCQKSETEMCPSVFCSFYGETQRTYLLIESIAKQDDVSPMAFSLSVHNAIAGQYSISSKNTCSSTTLSPSDKSYLPAFAEALGLLEEGAKSVLVVCFEEHVPNFYRPFVESVEYPTAIAFSISLCPENSAEPAYTLNRNANEGKDTLPQIMQLIRFFTEGESQLQQARWQLQRT